jgi:glycosyltransferase involved in cell wall biosynthesis
MKVILNTHTPFGLAHGGAQVNIERSRFELTQLGVDADVLRWWDAGQKGDVLHHFGYLPLALIRLAKKNGLKVVITLLLTETCNRTNRELFFRKLLIRGALAAPLPAGVKEALPWRAYREVDRMIVGLEVERRILKDCYGIPGDRISVIPSGLSDAFLNAKPGPRIEEHLICQGRIGPTKRAIELAQLARTAQVPVLFVGKPFDFDGDYWRQFSRLIDNRYVLHDPNVASEAALVERLGRSRGYVLLSRFENWCLAAHEAAACGLPLLLPDQPWARERFGRQASYFPRGSDGDAGALRKFFQESPDLAAPKVRNHSWAEVAAMMRDVYQELLN